MTLSTPLSELSRVGKTTASRLSRLGLKTVEDLIFYFPFRYEDYSLVKKIKDLIPNEAVTIRGKVQLIASRRSFRKRKIVTEALISDDSGSLKVIWFNQPFLTKNIKVGDELYLSGRLDETRMQMISPDYEKCKAQTLHTARIVPIYPLTEGVTQKQVRFLLGQTRGLMAELKDFLPVEIVKRRAFLSLNKAVGNIHFPSDLKVAERARQRLQFDELFLIQLAIQRAKKELSDCRSLKMSFLKKPTQDFVKALPFTLTAAQKKSAWEIIQDLTADRPMNRLLEGDVGSGKTVVAALTILNVVRNGYKVALMAPTSILAEQHYKTLTRLFQNQNIRLALFTAGRREIKGGAVTKKKILEQLKAGDFDVVIGTQAVIQGQVQMKDLGLVIVDEQHRFGVNQRKTLLQKDRIKDYLPHFLSMTATPIPRSLVLALYGDLDLSVINEMPSGRQPIMTKVIYEQQRAETYEFIRQQIKEGRQAFVICPLIDPSDKMGFKSATLEFEKLSQSVFLGCPMGLLHGRLKAKEKEEVMARFTKNELKILVATSVIEVGIDVPNATIMIIEGADHFGLAQLHQFRGRVGRGQFQSHCFLFSETNAPLARKRLKYMETCRDGFKLAEKDLELRGPGEVYGVRQSGLPDLKIASLADSELIKAAQAEAKEVLKKPVLTPELAKVLERVKVSMHFE